MIRKAIFEDIDKILVITQACTQDLTAQNIFQWNEHYPNRSAFERDVNHGALYVLEQNDGVIGCIVLSEIMDQVYQKVKWISPDGQNLYLHRLAVHPSVQGLGHAQRLMDFAENFARHHRFNSIRLDTFSQNLRNQRFYERRGYQKLSSRIFFPKQSKQPFYCYELVL